MTTRHHVLTEHYGSLRPTQVKEVKLPLSTTWRRIGGEEAYIHSFLTSALDAGEWSKWLHGIR